MRVVELNIHPLKSAGRIPVERWPLGPTGLRHDRHFMLVDPNGDFITLRGTPRMVTILPSLGEPPSAEASRARFVVAGASSGGGEAPHGAGGHALEVPLGAPEGARLTVQIWGDHVEARVVSAEADAWFTRVLGRPVHLVVFDEGERRQVDLRFARPGDHTQFADGFPLLVTTTGSLAALANELGHEVAMARFRPNLVVETDAPFVEDGWRRIRVGEIELELVKPCARCVGITVEPGTGRTSKEPLASLARLRTRDGKVYFGQNAVHRGVGTLAVGDPVEVVERAEPA